MVWRRGFVATLRAKHFLGVELVETLALSFPTYCIALILIELWEHIKSGLD